jgi:hypothetical protein
VRAAATARLADPTCRRCTRSGSASTGCADGPGGLPTLGRHR